MMSKKRVEAILSAHFIVRFRVVVALFFSSSSWRQRKPRWKLHCLRYVFVDVTRTKLRLMEKRCRWSRRCRGRALRLIFQFFSFTLWCDNFSGNNILSVADISQFVFERNCVIGLVYIKRRWNFRENDVFTEIKCQCSSDLCEFVRSAYEYFGYPIFRLQVLMLELW